MAPFSTHPSYLDALDNIGNECIAGPYPEFFRKFASFRSKDELCTTMNDVAELESKSGGTLRQPKSVKDVTEWFMKLMQAQVPGQKWNWVAYDTPAATPWVVGTNFIMIPQLNDGDELHAGAICHLASETETYQAALVHLYCMASEVFQAQNLRHFLHGILFFQSTIEFWVIDRSGMYASEALDATQDYTQIMGTVLAFKYLTPSSLGAGDVLKKISGKTLCTFHMPDKTLFVQEKPITARDWFGDGLCCFLAHEENESRPTHLVKFKWRNLFKGKEEEIFDIMKEKNVEGVPKLLYSTKIVDTAQLRAGLRHQPYRRLLEDGSELEKGSGLARYSERTDSPFRNRTCVALVFKPICKPLSTFRDTLELLSVLRDAVQTHRTLLQTANILHRDISDGNILILEVTRKGLLIDFDIAMDLSKNTPTGNSIGGTGEFMAAGLMNKDPHTYRHDLEAFFYVLLQVITCDKGDLPENSRFQRWAVEDWDMARDARIEDMKGNGLEGLLNEWGAEYAGCKGLARQLWRLLFKDDKEIFLGTDTSVEGTNALYDGFLEAFDNTIAVLRQRAETASAE